MGKLTEADEARTSSNIQVRERIESIMHNCTLKRYMNRQGFKYLHLKEKTVFYPDDLVKCTKFTRKCNRLL